MKALRQSGRTTRMVLTILDRVAQLGTAERVIIHQAQEKTFLRGVASSDFVARAMLLSPYECATLWDTKVLCYTVGEFSRKGRSLPSLPFVHHDVWDYRSIVEIEQLIDELDYVARRVGGK